MGWKTITGSVLLGVSQFLGATELAGPEVVGWLGTFGIMFGGVGLRMAIKNK